MDIFDRIDNLSLIENCLLHLKFEISRELPSYFRIAREAHLLLYRSMIEALKGTANLVITGHSTKRRSHKYKRHNKPWQEIHKVSIEACKRAWRFLNQSRVKNHSLILNNTKISQLKISLSAFTMH